MSVRLVPLVALSTLALAAPPALAAERPADEPMRQSAGVMVSNIAGSGLTYMLENGPGGMGFHVSAIGWGQGATSFVNFGGAMLHDISRQEWGALYGLAAIGVGSRTSATSKVPSLETNFAPGLGVRWGMVRAELGYSFYTNPEGSGFTPAGGAGLMLGF